MPRREFLDQVRRLRGEGKSIRVIAAELDVHRSRVHRALNALAQTTYDRPDPLKPLLDRPFVGRQREISELSAALNNALSGRGCLAMLVGQPGIGKTRTSQELALIAEERGAQVLWGRCYEGQGAPPYWPWIQIIRSYLQGVWQGHHLERLRAAMGMGAADIAAVVPEVKEALPDLEPSPRSEPEQARFRLFDSITSFLKNASMDHPLVLLLDNLHWADRSSLLLLEYLSQELTDARILVIGTYRDEELFREHPLPLTLGELAKHPHFQRIILRGLTLEGTRQLIELVSGDAPIEELAEVVYRRTEGNPFFVTEVVRMLAQEGALAKEPAEGQEGLSLRVPEGVKEAIGRRLHRLSGSCNQVLTVASVVGREFELELMKRLIPELSEERFLGVVEEALTAGIIEEIPDAAGRCQFTHLLIQETLSQELSAARRARLHGEIGEALERLHTDDVEAHADELAYHFAEAEPSLGGLKLVRYSLMAGERALAAYAWEEALAHFQRGLAAKGVALTGMAPAGDAEAAGLLFGLGQAREGTQERLWSGSEVLASFHRAFDYFVGAGDAERAVDIAAHYISSNIGAELIAKALELVSPDSHDAGRLLSRYIFPLRADYEKAQEAFHRALAIAQQQQDLELEMITLVSGACVDFVQCHFQESLDRNLRAIELAERVDHPASEAHARYDLTHVLYAMGDLEGAASHATAMLGAAERSGVRAWHTNAMEANENVSSARGDWKAAREFSDQGLASDPRHTILLGSRALLEYQVGDFDAGEAYLERLLESILRSQSEPSTPVTMATPWYAAPAVVIPVVAYITSVATRFDMAEAIAQRAVSSPYVQLGVQNAARIGLALMAVQRADAVAAGDLYAALVSTRGTMFPQCPWGHALAADRILGLLSRTVGKPEQATAHFEDALAFCRKAGYRPELAWSCHDYADILLTQNGPGDHQKTMCLLDEALAISTELGMRPLMERAVALQARAGSLAAKAPAYPGGLTGREAEVLRLIASGKSNAEIAGELVLSIRTVERHISNIYGKTGSGGRAGATAFAFTSGLMSPQVAPE